MHAACGDQEAFRQLWEAHHAVAQAAAQRLSHQRTLAEEITQGAFLLAWRGLPLFKKGRPFRPWLMRILLVGTGLLAGVALIVCWMHHLPLVGAPVALALWAVVAWRWHAQARSIAFRADSLMVRWLGRGSTCSGLHALAERSRAPGCRRWGEPSLMERIERVCGVGVEAREKRLTLVG